MDKIVVRNIPDDVSFKLIECAEAFGITPAKFVRAILLTIDYVELLTRTIDAIKMLDTPEGGDE